MYKDYKEQFLEGINIKDKYIYSTCFDKAIASEKDVAHWRNEDLDNFLVSMNSISVNSIRKYLAIFREVHGFLSNKEGVEYNKLQPTKKIFEYIAYPQLRSRILTYDDYKRIRNLLTFVYEGREYNFRDKVMYELAWEGLSNSEIRYLRHDDIKILNYGINNNKAVISLMDGREIIIDDQVVVSDLMAALDENTYVRVDKNGKMLCYPYKLSKYLIKPIAITDKSKHTSDESVSNPSLMMRQIFSKLYSEQMIKSFDENGKVQEMNLENLNLEDIRRSKIIYMLAINQYLSVGDIAKLFGKNVECDLYWLKDVSKRIYGK